MKPTVTLLTALLLAPLAGLYAAGAWFGIRLQKRARNVIPMRKAG